MQQRPLLRWLAGLALVAALAAAFALYAQPTVVVALAEQVWACFGW